MKSLISKEIEINVPGERDLFCYIVDSTGPKFSHTIGVTTPWYGDDDDD